MKKILKYICLSLLFVFSITLASCDEETELTHEDKTNNNIEDNNSNNNETAHEHKFSNDYKYDENNGDTHKRYCVDCKQYIEFEHTYGDWENTVFPTTFLNGLQTKRCECGHEVTQTVPSKQFDLVSDEYTTKLLESFDNKLCLTITNADIKYEGEDENIILTMSDAELYIEFDEEFNIYAYAEGEAETTFDGVKATFSADAVFKDDWVYILVDETGFEYDTTFKYYSDSTTIISDNHSAYKIPASQVETGEVPMDEYLEEIQGMLSSFEEEINFITENINEDVLDICLNLAVKEVVNTVFTKTESEDSKTYSLNYEALSELNVKLDTKTISELYDDFFEEGAYDQLCTYVFDVFDMTFADLNKYVNENNLDVKSIIELIDKLIKLVDEEASLGLLFETMTNDEIKDVIAYFNQSSLKDTKVVDFISEYTVDISEYKDVITEVLNSLKDITIYEFVGMLMEESEESSELQEVSEGGEETEYSELKQMVDSFIELFDIIDNCSFTTDLEGNITDIDLVFDLSVFEEMANTSGTIAATVEFDYNASFDAEAVINEVDDVVAKIAINSNTTTVKEESEDDSSCVYYHDEFIFDANGRVTGYSRITEHISSNYITMDDNTITHDVNVTRDEYSVDLSNAPMIITSECSNIYDVEYLNNGYYTSTYKFYPGVVVDLDEYNSCSSTKALNSYFYGVVSNLTPSEERAYSNETNGLRLIYNYSDNTVDFNRIDSFEMHNLVLNEEKSFTGTACGDLIVEYYVCSDCGIHLVKYEGVAHKTVTVEYGDVENCDYEDIEMVYTCSDCGQSWVEYVSGGHSETLHEIEVFEDSECSKQHSMCGFICACEYKYMPDTSNLDTTMVWDESEKRMYCDECNVSILVETTNDYLRWSFYVGDYKTTEPYLVLTSYNLNYN